MAENRFDELQRELELSLAKLKAATQLERRRFYLREMSRLRTEGEPHSPNAEERPEWPVAFSTPER